MEILQLFQSTWTDISNLKELEEKISELENKKFGLESSVKELEGWKLELEYGFGSLGQTVGSVLEHMSSGVDKVFCKVADAAATRLKLNLAELGKSYKEYLNFACKSPIHQRSYYEFRAL